MTDRDAAAKLAGLISGLKREGLVRDWSQIALLTFSTRETNRAIGTYTAALRAAGIPLYNPRSAAAQKDERLQALVGALSFMTKVLGSLTSRPSTNVINF